MSNFYPLMCYGYFENFLNHTILMFNNKKSSPTHLSIFCPLILSKGISVAKEYLENVAQFKNQIIIIRQIIA